MNGKFVSAEMKTNIHPDMFNRETPYITTDPIFHLRCKSFLKGKPCGSKTCKKVHGFPFQDFVACRKYVESNSCPYSARSCYYLHPDSLYFHDYPICTPRERNPKPLKSVKRLNNIDVNVKTKIIQKMQLVNQMQKLKLAPIDNQPDIEYLQSTSKQVPSIPKLQTGNQTERQPGTVPPHPPITRPLAGKEQTESFEPLQLDDDMHVLFDDYQRTIPRTVSK